MESHTQMYTFKESYMPLRNNILYNKFSNLVPRVSILPVPLSERERETLVWYGHVHRKIWDVAKKKIVRGAIKFTF